MKKLLLVLFLISCAAGGKTMDLNRFQEVSIGASVDELVEKQGAPYSINKLKSGAEEYEYIERISLGGKLVGIRYYYFLVKEGRIISKRFNDNHPHNLIDSYDLQTMDNMDSSLDLDVDPGSNR